MNVKTIIKDTVALLSPVTKMIVGWKQLQNISADAETSFPIAFLDLPINTNVSARISGAIERAYNCILFFANKTDVDSTAEEHDVVIQNMYLLSTAFISKLQNNKSVKSIHNIRETEILNQFDVNVSGIILEVSITLYPDNTVC